MEDNLSDMELKEANLFAREFRMPTWWIGDPRMDSSSMGVILTPERIVSIELTASVNSV